MAARPLQDFVEEVNGGSRLRVEHDYGGGFVRLGTSEAERRQAAQDIQCSENIVLELLRNSRDAHAAHVFMALSKEGSRRTIAVIDDGDGIPAAMHELVFEPRVTSKLDSSHMDAWGLHGRGMALFSIAQNSLSARVTSSGSALGCSLVVETDTGALPERADQSGFPRFLMSEDGSVNVRGPRNILRTSCEFAIESRDSCSVFVGSPAEVAAALYAFGLSSLSAVDRAFCPDAGSLPVVKRLATASDPADLSALAAGIGLAISARTARRILDGEIDEAPNLLERVTIEGAGKPGAKRGRRGGAPGKRLRLQRADAEELARSAREAFAGIAGRYYLEAEVEPRVRVMRDKVTITIPVVEKP